MTRKQKTRNIALIKKELLNLDFQLKEATAKGDRIYDQHKKLYDELSDACDELGLQWAQHCKAFHRTEMDSCCSIQKWKDTSMSAKFCIGCPIGADKINVNLLACKLKPQVREDDSA